MFNNCSYGLSLEEDSDYGSLMCKTKGTSVGKLAEDNTIQVGIDRVFHKTLIEIKGQYINDQ